MSAADVANSTDNIQTTQDIEVVKSSNVSDISLSNADNQILSEGEGTFSDLHNDILNGELTRNYVFDSGSDSGLTNGIVISTDMTIDGKGNVVIDAANQARVFNIASGATVVLKGITFINANADGDGGSILADGKVTIIDCNFLNSNAQGSGGAVAFATSESYVENTKFINNTADVNGGAVFIKSTNGNNNDHTGFDICTFINNTAGRNGGAVDWSAGATNGYIKNSIFTNNTAQRSGGAVYWNGHYGTISNTNFTHNNATGKVIDGIGGGDGGAVLWIGSHGIINNNCYFNDNYAAYRGGAIFLHGDETENCTNTTVDSCVFKYNVAGINGGAIDWQKGAHDGMLSNSLFINNTAYRSGGAVFWFGTNGTIKDSNFTNNTALGIVNYTDSYGNITYGGYGGAVIWTGSTGDVINSRFIGNEAKYNSATNSGGCGGAVYLQGSSLGGCSNTTFNTCIFISNIAGTNGGAIDWHEGAHDGLVEYCIFINNTAKRSAGAVFWNGHNGTIKYSRFTNNRATGVYRLLDIDVTYENIIVVNKNEDEFLSVGPTSADMNKLYALNYTDENNNTIRIFKLYAADDSTGTLKWVKLDETTVNIQTISLKDWAIDQFFGGDGGTILWSGDIGLIYNCNFTDSNSARRGGGAYMTGSDYVTYDHCNFINCTSGTNGGGVDWLAGANYGKIYNCVFNGTRAARSAGAIYYDGWYGEMINVTIINVKAYGGSIKTSDDGLVKYAGWDSSHWDTNNTGGDAGAIMFTGNHEYLYNVTFINCTATGRGGAVFLQDNYNITFDTCVFENNLAEGSANNTHYDRFDTTTPINKFRTGYGGAIGFDYGSKLGIIKNSVFTNNTAVRIGGAISYASGSTQGIIYNTNFTNNVAYRSGGAISWDGENGNMSYCTFTNNRALGTDIDTSLFNLESLSDIVNVTSIDQITSTDKLYVLVEYDGDVRKSYTMYIYDGANPVKLEETTETGPSYTDWAIDEYYGGDGGTIFWRGDHGIVDHCNFIGSNSARRGGGAYMTGSDNITFQNSYFFNCTSGTNGGGLDWLAGANYGKVINCTFNETRAARSAGAIYYDGDYGEMRNIYIVNTQSWGGTLTSTVPGLTYAGWDLSHWDTNTTGGDAGAIMFTGNHEYLYNVTFINCTSQGRGGAVFLQDNQNVTFDLCRFIECEALGIATNTWNDYTKERDDSNNDTKIDYKLTGHGGAIAFDVGAHDAVIKNSEFTFNYARRDGGAINIAKNAFNASVENCKFTNNSCGDDGGAINWEGDLGIVKNITCYNNTGRAYADPVTGASTSKGGTICLTGDNVTITKSSFKLGTVLYNNGKLNETDAGAIFLTGNHAVVSHNIFDTCWVPNYAGAIQIIGNDTVVNNCTFINCNATEDGGALYVTGVNCHISNSTFTNNLAGDDGGAIYWKGNLGGIYNVTCTNNRGISLGDSTSIGGSISIIGDNVTVDKSYFTLSSATYSGGAIFVSGSNVNITRSDFLMCNVSHNAADAHKDYLNGGGSIYVMGNSTNIINCTFDRTNAKEGGVMYIQGNNAAIINVTAVRSFALNGGSIYVKGANVLIIHSDISMGNATKDGGSIYIEGFNATITDSSLRMCTADNDGGTVYISGDSATIKNTKFLMTMATRNGGSVYIKGVNAEILNSNFTQSRSQSGGVIYVDGDNTTINKISSSMTSVSLNGASIYVKGNNAIIEKSNFDKNNATINGGGIYVEGDNTKILDSNFSTDIAFTGDGAAIYVGGKNTTISGATSKITRSVQGRGGTIYVNGEDTVIKDSSFAMSNSAKDGGSIYISGARSKVINTNISKTVSGNNGGAVYIDAENALISGSHFNMNNATRDGGAIYIKGNYANITNSTFNMANAFYKPTANDVKDCGGGAIFCEGSYSNIYYSNFTNCYAVGSGGAIFFYGLAGKTLNYCNVVGCVFINNTVNAHIPGTNTKGGGAIFLAKEGQYNSIRDSKFINNSAQATLDKVEGGAILWDFSLHSLLDNCVFDGNFITSTKIDNWIQGGAIYSRDRKNLTISNCVFKDSSSQKEAGALYLANDRSNALAMDILVINTTFVGNVAKGYAYTTEKNNFGGGAIQLKEAKNVWFRNVNFTNNTANQGGAIVLYTMHTDSTHFVDCNFDGNEAKEKGGAIFADNGNNNNLRLTNVKLTNNIAADDGGAIYTYYFSEQNNVTFINNSANHGGALYWNRGSMTIQNMVFINNSANQGGAIYIPQTGITVSNNEFSGNTAIDGGAIYVQVTNTAIKNNNFTNNSAVYGGAIFAPINNNNVLGISDSTFYENSANYGGAIYSGFKDNNNDRNIKNCNFTSNTADYGGAIYIPNIQIIKNCYFNGNNATFNGGSVYVDASAQEATISDSVFINSSADNGGAIYNDLLNEKVTINNDTFIKNIARYNGGAVLYRTTNKDYRDYNKFDTIGVILSNGRTDVTTVDTRKKFISTSYFKDNEDYKLHIITTSDLESPIITVFLDSPRDALHRSINFTVTLTDLNNSAVYKVIVNSSNYYSYYNPLSKLVYVPFNALIVNHTYNISVSFSDENYMLKFNSTNDTAHGEKMGDFKRLQSRIERNIIASGDSDIVEITLERSFTFTIFEDDLSASDKGCMNLTHVNKPLIIHGNGWTIDAKGFSRIFYITADNITFENVVFAGGNSSGKYNDSVDIGGALYWAGKYGALLNSQVIDSEAYRGGGIYFNASASDCRIINSTFRNNRADTNGGAIDCNASRMRLENTTFEDNYAGAVGAALCRETNATEGSGKNNIFSNNHADVGGAALAWINATRISIDTYYFYNNTAGYSGGAIYVGEGSKECEILSCVFENNSVENENDGHGGAIEWYSEKGIVSNSNFTNNHAYDGGAIYVGSESGQINITGSNFRQNYAISKGGAISIAASDVNVTESNFYYNNATNGGALYVGGDGTTNYIYLSNFEGNVAKADTMGAGFGGAIDWVASSGHIISSNFTGNLANYGGGLYLGVKSNESIIENCIFKGNHAKYNGGAIDCNASKMVLTNTLFDSNYAQYGAALCREVNAKRGSGENNTFINNHAYVSGAALGWMASTGIKIVNYTFINNSADVSGGAIYVSPTSHNCSIIDSRFEDNYVTNKTAEWDDDQFSWIAWDGTTMTYRLDYTSDPAMANRTVMDVQETILYYTGLELPQDLGVGGAVNILASNANITNSNFTRNTARLGGALYVGSDSGNTIIDRSIFRANEAYERGGAVNLHASGADIDDSKFYDNKAVDGGALYVGGVGTENNLHRTIFEGNNATGYGAGIYWVASAGDMDQLNFTRNSAMYGGGIYFNGMSGNTNLTNVIFKSNNATKNGGAIECNASNIGISNITFESNYAGEYGAALCRESGATSGHGSNNTFIKNHAGISGAALAWMSVDNININDYKFIDNTAGFSGAAIYISYNSDNCIINNSYFKGNNITSTTRGHGGAIDIVGDDASIINSNFTDNHAVYGGAIFAGDSSGNTNIYNATFSKNGAVLDGGAVQIRGSGVTLNQTHFHLNVAGRSGGAIYVGGTGTTNVVYHSEFTDNQAGDHGGAIDWIASAGEVYYSNFIRNTAVYGGALYLNGISSNSKIFNVYFKENRATKNGGAIDCNATMMGLNNTIFISNYAGEYGAALCREDNAAGGFGENNTFIANHAEISGAALAWLGVDGININNYTFINNTADISGGAIYVRADSPNCNVRNSHFDNNYVTDVREGRGGAIDWLGDNGYIYNTTFEDSFAVNGGTLYVGNNSNNMIILESAFSGSRAVGEGGSIVLYGNNASISKSNFSYSIGLIHGGAIAAHGAYNSTITDCIFYHTVGAGYVDPTNASYGSGGSIYWENSNNLNISNSQFLDVESHAMGTITAINCNDSSLYNLTFKGIFALSNGGSIAWIDSNNLTVDLCDFKDSSAAYSGGAIFLNNTNAVVKNSNFNNTSTPWGNGGAIYVSGNVTMDNLNMSNFGASEAKAGAIYLHRGNSTISNSNFDGENTIGIYHDASAIITNNNITGDNSNRDLMYLDEDYNEVTNPVFYSVWNDGNLTLEGNNFTYVIFNNGTINSQTYTYMMGQYNNTYNVTWMDEFTFWAEILDDTKMNHIISVDSLYCTNDVHQDVGKEYKMKYNRIKIPQTYYQGSFHLQPTDDNLKRNEIHNGTVNVKMPLTLTLEYIDLSKDKIIITATLTPKAQSNFTLANKLVFKFGDKEYEANLTDNGAWGVRFYQWTIANATHELNNLAAGHYTVSAYYPGDDTHKFAEAVIDFNIQKRLTLINISVNSGVWGYYPVANITTNGNGTILLSMNGRTERLRVYDVDGNYTSVNGTLKYSIVNGSVMVPFDTLYDPGEYTMSAVYVGDEYYEYALNDTNFTVYKRNTTINATPTNIVFWQDEIINVTVDKNTTGYIKITLKINGKDQEFVAEIINGTAQFVIANLFSGNYTNVPVVYKGDVHFNGNQTFINFTVGPTDDFNMSVKVDDITYGQNATVRVKVPSMANGTVTIYVDGVEWGTVELDEGTAELGNISGLAGGEHFVNVTYNGGVLYAAKNMTNRGFNVTQSDYWDMRITSDEHPYGENTTITIVPNVKLSNKNLTIIIDDVAYVVNITNNTATLTLNNLSAGVHSARVNYTGDANYTAKSKIFRVKIDKAQPTVTLTQVGNDIIATVSGNATGNVTFHMMGREYTLNLTQGNATLSNNLTIGNNYIIAEYNSDGNHSYAIAMKNFVIDPITTALTVNVTPEVIISNNEATIIVNMTNVTAGTVLIEVNGYNYTVAINASGIAKLVISLPAGKYNATAYYLGDLEHVACSNISNNFEVIDKITPEINITAPDVVKVGETVNITVNTNGYNLTVWINGVKQTVSGGNVSFVVPKAGSYTVVAAVTENATVYGASNFTVFTAVKSNATLVIDPIDAKLGEELTITVTNVTDGNIIIKVNNVTVADGKFTPTAPGVYTVTVESGETDKFNAAFNVTAFTIGVKETPVITIVAPDVVKVGETVNITVNTNGYNLTVWINGAKQNIVDGNILYTVTSAGINTIYAETDKNATVYAANKTVVFEAVKNNATLNIVEISVVKVGDEVTIAVSNITDGKLTIKLNGVEIENNTKVTISSRGNYTITVESAETGMYYAGFNSTTFEAVKSDAAVDIKVNATYYVDESFEIEITNDTIVNVTINGKEYPVVNGKVQVTGLPAGEYIITATIKESDIFNANSKTKVFNIIKYNSTINVSTNSIKVDDVAVINITVPSDIDGTVKVNINGTNYTVDIAGGNGSLEIKDLKAGTYTINVTYIENGKYLTSSKGTTLEVSKRESSVTVKVDNITVGDVALINITVTAGATGNVTIKIGDEYTQIVGVTDGTISVAVPNLTVRDKTVEVIYNGDAKFKTNSDSANFTVGKASTVIFVVVQNITFGDVETITAFIDATGNVTIKLNGNVIDTVDIIDGKVEFPVNLDAGNYTVEVIYNGNVNTSSVSAEANFTVDTADPTITVEVKDIVYGSVERIIIRSNADGRVNVTVNGIVKGQNLMIENGEAELNVTGLGAGKYSVEVTFIGNDNYMKTVTATFNVMKANTTLDVEISSSVKLRETQMINITVSNVNATGEVIIVIDGENYTAPLTNGRGNFTIPALASGNHTVTVIYEGDGNFTGNWTAATFEVTKLESSLNVTAKDVDTSSEVKIVLSELPGDATGYVIVNVNGTEYSVDITQTKELSIPIIHAGTYSVTARYLGDENYTSSTASTTFNANKVSSDVEVEVKDTVAGGDIEVKVTLPPNAEGNITVTVGNETKTVDAHGGENTIVISNVTEGTYNVTTTYSGDDKYDSKTVTKTVTVLTSINVEEKLTRGINSPYDYEAVFFDRDGSALKNADVKFVVNGKTYTAKTDEKGIARITDANLGLGTYNVTSINPATGQEITKPLTIVKRLVENKDLTMDFASGKYYSVKVIGDDGKPVGEGEYIGISIHGVKYAVKTDSKGYAKLQIKLNPGSYTVSAEYKNTKVSNKIKVKQTLKLVKKTVSVKKGKKLILKATLKWTNGKAIKGKVIKFKFKGKTYKAKTNSKGLAKVTIKAKVTKKLKKGKKFTYSATYLTNTLKGKVKIK